MRAALMKDKGLLEVGEIPDPRPRAGEALVEVYRAGICGSDLVTLASGRRARRWRGRHGWRSRSGWPRESWRYFSKP